MTTEQAQERIIILNNEVSGRSSLVPQLEEALPGAEIVEASSLDEYLATLSLQEFDVVVLDYDLPEVRSRELLAQLKVRDNEPDVLLVSRCDDSATVKSIAKSQKRYVVRDDCWVESVGQALRDMLRIRKLEEEMSHIRARLTEANEKLEVRNKRLDEFCATIAHDIRSPLAGLALKVEYVLETQRNNLDERTIDLLQRSVESTRRIVGVVQAMYEFAKLGFTEAAFSHTPLTPLVQEVLSDLHLDRLENVKVRMHDLPVVWGNADLLRRVFSNLLTNAIKYSHRDNVEIEISFDTVVKRGMGEFAQITVADNGPGIASEDVDAVFTMFSRGNGADRGSDGLGLGLAIVQRVIELHQGAIEVLCEPGEGASFVIQLPLKPIQLSGVA